MYYMTTERKNLCFSMPMLHGEKTNSSDKKKTFPSKGSIVNYFQGQCIQYIRFTFKLCEVPSKALYLVNIMIFLCVL